MFSLKTIKPIPFIALIVLALIIPMGCSTRTAAIGDSVNIDFSLWLDDGTIYYSTTDHGPLDYTLGTGELIQGAEDAIIGMRVGEIKEVIIPPEKAFGDVLPGLIQTVSRDLMPAGFVPEVGSTLNTQLNGQTVDVVIVDVTDTTVTVDANHELAGKSLKLDVKLLDLTHPGDVNNLMGQPPLVWVLGGGLAVLATAFLVYFLMTQQRLSELKARARPRRHQ
jgi:peptidylprolyl isomerase